MAFVTLYTHMANIAPERFCKLIVHISFVLSSSINSNKINDNDAFSLTASKGSITVLSHFPHANGQKEVSEWQTR